MDPKSVDIMGRAFSEHSDRSIIAYISMIKQKNSTAALDKFMECFNHTGNDKKLIIRGFQRLYTTIPFILYNNTLEIASISTICVKLSLDDEQCILGYIYMNNSPTEIVPAFVCASPTFTSRDGEYRSRFITWDNFMNIMTEYADDISPLEDMICNRMESGRLTFQADMYCLDDTKKVEEFINNSRIIIKLFMLAWIPDFYRFHHKIAPNHTNPVYKKIIYKPEDLSVWNSIHENVSKRDPRPDYAVTWMIYLFSINIGAQGNEWTIPIMPIVGQKIMPVTIIEAMLPDDINFSTWREIRINQLVSNLVINVVSPSFPVINSWFFIPNAHVGLFDNVAMREKYVDADVAGEIISQLHIIDEKNYEDEDEETPRSGKFAHLSQNIRQSIKYAARDIKLSDLAVCITGEDVGRTLRDFPSYLTSGYADEGEKLFLEDSYVFAKHIFEFIYAFYCMNTISGLIHGDLHLNNATIHRLIRYVNIKYAREDDLSPTDDMRVVYICKQAYVFPFTGCFSSLIDFSRAIIGNEHDLVERFGRRYSDIYFHDQVDRIIDILSHNFPEFMELNLSAVTQFATMHPTILFKVITALDTYTLMNNICAMIEIDPNMKQLKFPNEMLAWLKEIYIHSEKLLINNLTSCINGQYTSVADFEWPNLVIIEKHFAKYVSTDEIIKDPSVTFIDMYNSNSNMEYDISDMNHWGPIISADEFYRKIESEGLHPDYIKKWRDHINKDDSERGKKMVGNIVAEDWMFM